MSLYSGDPHYGVVATTLASAQVAIIHARMRMQHCHDEATKKALAKTRQAVEHQSHAGLMSGGQPQNDEVEAEES